MCYGCNVFPFGCGSPLCLTGEEGLEVTDNKVGVYVKSVDTHSNLDKESCEVDSFLTQKNCSRCGVELRSRILSKFNLDVLCLKCCDAEKLHPKYKEAADAELAQVKAGNYNYTGLYAGKKFPFNT